MMMKLSADLQAAFVAHLCQLLKSSLLGAKQTQRNVTLSFRILVCWWTESQSCERKEAKGIRKSQRTAAPPWFLEFFQVFPPASLFLSRYPWAICQVHVRICSYDPARVSIAILLFPILILLPSFVCCVLVFSPSSWGGDFATWTTSSSNRYGWTDKTFLTYTCRIGNRIAVKEKTRMRVQEKEFWEVEETRRGWEKRKKPAAYDHEDHRSNGHVQEKKEKPEEGWDDVAASQR